MDTTSTLSHPKPSGPLPRLRRSLGPVSSCERDRLVRLTQARLAGANAIQRGFIERYEAVCPQPRNRFLWRWVLHALEVVAVPGVDRKPGDEAALTAKFLGVLLTVVLDDFADGGATPDEVRWMCAAVFDGDSIDRVYKQDRPMTELAIELSSTIIETARQLPGYAGLAEFLEFDYRQLANTMHYSALTNRHQSAGNVTENAAYQCHNMHMVVFGTIDLMALPSYNPHELGAMRELFYIGQRMGRIGNEVSTWSREAELGDTTSTVFPLAAEHTGLSITELAALDSSSLKARVRESGAESRLLGEWSQLRKRARDIAFRIRSFEPSDYIFGLERLLELHLSSRGMK